MSSLLYVYQFVSSTAFLSLFLSIGGRLQKNKNKHKPIISGNCHCTSLRMLDLRWQHARQSFTSQGLRTTAGNGSICVGCWCDCWRWVLWDCSLHWWHLTASEWITPWRFWHILSESTILDSHAINIVQRLFTCLRRETSKMQLNEHY